MLTAILFIVSSLLLFGAAMAHRRRSVDYRKVVAALLVGIGIVFLFFGLEEISWGQRLFGWSTPVVLQQINDQGELNVHNLDNSLIVTLYRWGIAAFALVTVAAAAPLVWAALVWAAQRAVVWGSGSVVVFLSAFPLMLSSMVGCPDGIIRARWMEERMEQRRRVIERVKVQEWKRT